jgi:hypothetical protein
MNLYILTTKRKAESVGKPASILVLAENGEQARLLAADSIGGLDGLDWLDPSRVICTILRTSELKASVLIFGFQP